MVKKSRTEIYLERFYQQGMTLTEIASLHGITVAAVRKAIIKHDPEAYEKEKRKRSEERREARREKDRVYKQKKRNKRKQEYIEEDEVAYAWLQMHFQRVFPATKRKSVSDIDLVWSACAQSGIQDILKSPHATKDVKAAIRAVYRKKSAQIEVIDQDYVTPLGCAKSGSGGGKSDRTQRIAMLR